IKREAKADKAYSAAVSAVMGKAKILNLTNDQPRPLDFATANSMQDIGRKLLQSIGFSEPDDASIQAAIEANDAFIERLQAIRNAALGPIDQDDDDQSTNGEFIRRAHNQALPPEIPKSVGI